MTDEEFQIKNRRRGELIEKKHSGFTDEEGKRPFSSHPGWKEECERREHANLTDAEREELARLQEECMEYLGRKYSRPTLPLDRILARLKKESGGRKFTRVRALTGMGGYPKDVMIRPGDLGYLHTDHVIVWDRYPGQEWPLDGMERGVQYEEVGE
jgi:hypothetical protein